MYNNAKENKDLSVNDIEGLNIQTDNFFTRNENKQEYSSGAISPLIGSIRNSVFEKGHIEEFQNEDSPEVGQAPIKSALKQINWEQK